LATRRHSRVARGNRLAIINKADKRMYRALYAFAASTAARASELFGLYCGDVDLEQGVITFRHGVVNGVESTTKSDTGDKERTRTCRLMLQLLKNSRSTLAVARVVWCSEVARGHLCSCRTSTRTNSDRSLMSWESGKRGWGCTASAVEE